jgi:cysteine desulfurase
VVVIGAGAPRLPNTTCLARPGLRAETLLIQLDLAGVAVSAGAACSSGKVGASHVLTAMGIADDLARAAIRISIGPTTTDADLDRFLDIWTSLGRPAALAA